MCMVEGREIYPLSNHYCLVEKSTPLNCKIITVDFRGNKQCPY